MRIVYFGNNTRGAICLDAICDAGFDVVAVVAHAETADNTGPGGVADSAHRRDIPVHAPVRINSSESIEWIRSRTPDLFVLAGYTKILGQEILSVPTAGAVNLHGGKIPEYRGASPLNWQILRGEQEGGCTILRVDEGIDTGEVLACETYPIGPDTTAGEAVERTLEIFPRILVDVLTGLDAGAVRGRQQDADAGCYYCKRYPWDGEIDWDGMADVEVHNLVRSLNGPGLDPAFSHLSGYKIEIVRTRVLDDEIRGPARRLALQRAGGVVVICKNRGLLIEQIAVDGELTAADDFLPRRGASFDRAGYWRLLANSTGLGLLEAAAGTRTE